MHHHLPHWLLSSKSHCCHVSVFLYTHKSLKVLYSIDAVVKLCFFYRKLYTKVSFGPCLCRLVNDSVLYGKVYYMWMWLCRRVSIIVKGYRKQPQAMVNNVISVRLSNVIHSVHLHSFPHLFTHIACPSADTHTPLFWRFNVRNTYETCTIADA